MDNLTNSNVAIFQSYKLFIEGEACPFVSATISYGVASTPQMIVEFAPYNAIRGLKERTKVSLFYLDYIDNEFKLLFDGEIRGEGYIRTPSVRNITYTVAHVSFYLEEVKVAYADPWSLGIHGSPVSSGGASYNSKVVGDVSMNTLVGKFFQKGISSDRGSTVFFSEFLEAVLNEHTGLDGNGKPKEMPKVLAYYLERFDQWTMSERLAFLPFPDEEPLTGAGLQLEDFFHNKEWQGFMQNLAKNSSGIYSLLELFVKVFNRIYYTPVFIPNPYYLEADPEDQSIPGRMQQIFFKPDTIFGMPPACNVIWPSMYSSFTYSRDFKSIPTRMFAREDDIWVLEQPLNAERADLSSARHFWAPSNVFTRDNLVEVGKSGVKSKVFELAFNADDAMRILTDEEKKFGVRISSPPDNMRLSEYIKWTAAVANTEREEDLQRIAKLVDYEYARQKLSTAATSVNMVFNPYLVPGFPCLILDKPDSGVHVYGYVMAITHTINTTSGARTMADISYMRQFDDDVLEDESASTLSFPVAEKVWTDENSVYTNLFGVPGMNNAPYSQAIPGSGNTPAETANLKEVVENIHQQLASGHFKDFTYNAYVRSYRPIMSLLRYSEIFSSSQKISLYSEPQKTLAQEAIEKIKQYKISVANRAAENS